MHASPRRRRRSSTATAPPARQTKSAECAPITSRRRLTRPPRPRAWCSRPPSSCTSSSSKPARAAGRPSAPRPSSTGGFADLAEVGREHRVLGPGGADRLVRRCSQAILPVCGVVKQRSSRRAARGQRGLVVDREVLRGEVGMRDHDLAHALLERRVDDGEDLVAARGGRSRARGRAARSRGAPRASRAARRRPRRRPAPARARAPPRAARAGAPSRPGSSPPAGTASPRRSR